jgi:hypothetical protein
MSRLFVLCLSGLLLLFSVTTASAQAIGLAVSLGNTLAGYVFDLYLRGEQVFELDGAPDWYGHNDDEAWDCAFGYEKGGLEAVDVAKRNATDNLVQQQERVVQEAIRVELQQRQLRDETERALVATFRQDAELGDFVRGNQSFRKVEYEDDEDVRAAFVAACLARTTIVEYQQARLQRITQQLSQSRATKAFSELDTELNEDQTPANTSQRDLPPVRSDQANDLSFEELQRLMRER